MKYLFSLKRNIKLWHYDLSGNVLCAVIQSLKKIVFFGKILPWWQKSFDHWFNSPISAFPFHSLVCLPPPFTHTHKKWILNSWSHYHIKGDIKKRQKWKIKKIITFPMMEKLSPWSSLSHSWLNKTQCPIPKGNPIQALPLQA